MTSEQTNIQIPVTAMSDLERNVINAIQNRKGTKIISLNFDKIETAPANRFIICQGTSTSQVSSIADNIREEVYHNLGIKPYNYDGYRNAQWIVIDYGNIMVHVFLPEEREYYNLEDLWSDAVQTVIPDLD